MHELKIAEIDARDVILRIKKEFSEKQSDSWFGMFYSFLAGQSAFWALAKSKPIIRLEDNSHVAADEGPPQAYLPTNIQTGFPTVKSSICADPEILSFLKKLGINEPNLVDDVVRNILPRYSAPQPSPNEEFPSDFKRIIAAFETDSKSSRARLIDALAKSFIIPCRDARSAVREFNLPEAAYIPTERLKSLFEDIAGVQFVDDSFDFLRGEAARSFLEAVGCSRYLRPIETKNRFTNSELHELRRAAGVVNNTGADRVEDYTLDGLYKIFKILRSLPLENRTRRARILWDALCEFEDRGGHSYFIGTYYWYYFHSRSTIFDAAFLADLNTRRWVPDAEGTLKPPSEIVFEEIAPPWPTNAYLLSKINFKPPIVAELRPRSRY